MRTMAKRPTIRDVAAEAGVSKSLVSLAYSSPNSVSDKRKEKILKAAEKLGYAPNFLARSLAADSGSFIAILVQDLHNPLIAEVADQVRIRLEKAGRFYYITSAMYRDQDGNPSLDKQSLRSIIDLKPESLLVIGSIPKIELLESLPSNLPIIVASGAAIGISRAISIRTDEDVAMDLVVGHLFDLGHRNIAYLSGVSPVVGKDRENGYLKAMKARGLEKYIKTANVKTDNESSGYEITKSLLNSKTPPTAIACFNDLIAVGAQSAIQELNSKISLVGYDNTYLSGLNQINLTTIDPGNREIADISANLLLSDEIKSKKLILSAPRLIVRSTSKKLNDSASK